MHSVCFLQSFKDLDPFHLVALLLLGGSSRCSHSAGRWGKRDAGGTWEGLCTRPGSNDVTSSHSPLAGTWLCGHT